MTFSAKRSRDDANLEPFPFENLDDEPRSVPHMKMLALKQSLRILLDGEFEEVLNEVEPGLGTEIASWPSHVIEDFVQEWLTHSGVERPGGEPGKPSPPSPSSKSTVTRSRPTSRSGGSRSRR